jgi:hypothetical protein
VEHARLLDCLGTDFARLRAIVPTDPNAAVPTCAGWTVDDLTRHVGTVYLHKAVAMRSDAEPDPWPPAELAGEEALALLDRAYTELMRELSTRAPEYPAWTWYTPTRPSVSGCGGWPKRRSFTG